MMDKKEKLIKYLQQLIETYTKNFYLEPRELYENYCWYIYDFQLAKNVYLKEINKIVDEINEIYFNELSEIIKNPYRR